LKIALSIPSLAEVIEPIYQPQPSPQQPKKPKPKNKKIVIVPREVAIMSYNFICNKTNCKTTDNLAKQWEK